MFTWFSITQRLGEKQNITLVKQHWIAFNNFSCRMLLRHSHIGMSLKLFLSAHRKNSELWKWTLCAVCLMTVYLWWEQQKYSVNLCTYDRREYRLWNFRSKSSWNIVSRENTWLVFSNGKKKMQFSMPVIESSLFSSHWNLLLILDWWSTKTNLN